MNRLPPFHSLFLFVLLTSVSQAARRPLVVLNTFDTFNTEKVSGIVNSSQTIAVGVRRLSSDFDVVVYYLLVSYERAYTTLMGCLKALPRMPEKTESAHGIDQPKNTAAVLVRMIRANLRATRR